jgi:hypothetical protein
MTQEIPQMTKQKKEEYLWNEAGKRRSYLECEICETTTMHTAKGNNMKQVPAAEKQFFGLDA